MKVLMVDFDNTLVKNPHDVDLTGDLNRFFETWRSLETKPVNYVLVNWLKRYPRKWGILTNRGAVTRPKLWQHCKELGLDPGFIMTCEGQKVEALKRIREQHEVFLIDNAAKYKPELMVQDVTWKQMKRCETYV